jgi:site-specific DNA-methyltransferase (adenine-specific)
MDAFELMDKLPDGFAQLVLTDPPYGIRYQNGYAYAPHPPIPGDTGIDYPAFARECYRVLRGGAHAYFFTRFDVYPYHYKCLTDAGFTVKNCLVIEKGHIGGIGDLYGSYANNCEWLIFCHKGRRTFNRVELLKNKGSVGKRASRAGTPLREYKTRYNCCWFGNDYPKSTYNASWKAKHGFQHPAMKNAECLEWLIQLSSNPGDIVIDPFAGSGSTAIAAINTGRRFIGSEIYVPYHQLAQNRILGAGGELREGGGA